MTSKWISADSIINKLNSNTGFTTCADVKRAIKIIQDEPGIDIVRCKECYMCDEEMWCSFYDSIMESDDYCSYGERESDE